MKSQDNNGCFNPLRILWWKKNIISHRLPATGYRSPATGHRLPVTVCLLLFFTLSCFSQETPVSLTYSSTQLGYGTSSVYDSYLSPLNYKGNNAGLLYEQMKNTGFLNGKVSAQHLFIANYSWTDNNPGTASYYTGLIEYSYGLLYRFKPAEKLQLFAGPQVGGLVGFVYNTRNGNNPATGKAHIDLGLSAIADYKLKICSQPVHLRYQFCLPFAGAMYSPEFGESYYEISLGNTKDLIHLSSFHNYIAIRNMLSAEIPLNSFTLRLSYHFSFYETRINSLDTRLVTNTFYVGFSNNFFVVPGKQKKNNYQYVFD